MLCNPSCGGCYEEVTEPLFITGDLTDWKEPVVGTGCSEEEISGMRKCYPQKNTADRGSSGLGAGVRVMARKYTQD